MSAVFAQTMLGDFTGLVTDTTGGVIPGVTVTVVNERTMAKRSTITDDTGMYRIDGVQVGTYTLEVEMEGFKRHVQEKVSVTPAVLKRIDVVLQVGEVADSMVVTDTVPVIQTQNATVATGLPAQVREMPIASMTRGALIGEQLVWAAGSAAGGVYTFVGNRADFNQYNVEGLQFNFISSSVSANALEEVSAVLSNAPAEYSRPVTVNATMKSGSNRFHGEYWLAAVNPCMDALRGPFSPATARRGPCVTSKRQFASVGGPIVKDKTFFFYSWARPNSFASESPGSLQSFPSLRMQAGDFSRYEATIIDPVTGQPFPGNIIPTSRISPVANAIIADFMGNTVQYQGDPESYTNNVQELAGRYRQDNDHNIKIDHNLGTRDIISGFYQRHKVISNLDRFHAVTATTDAFHTTLQDNVLNWSAGINHTHTFGNASVNQLRIGATRFVYTHGQMDTWDADAARVKGADFVARWGLQGVSLPDLSGMPQIAIDRWLRTYNDNETGNYDTRYSVYDNFSTIKGRHVIKFGYSAVKLLQDGPASGAYFGGFNFGGVFTGAEVASNPQVCAAPAICGDAFADFLLGLPISMTRYQPRSTIARRKWEHGAFIQDDFRLSSRLTLNYGLRWARFTIPYDKNGMYYNFDPETLSIVVPDEFARERVHPSWPAAPFPVRLASEVGFPEKLIEGSNSWQPRLGFAYQLSPKMVVRGGYGVYNGASRFGPLQTGGPYVISESFTNEVRAGSPAGALFSWPNAFPTEAQVVTIASATGYSKDYRPAYSQNWNLTVEREVIPNWGLQVSYRGVKNTQLLWGRNLNAVPASPTPWSQERLPYPNLSGVTFIENGGNSWYQGIEFRLTHPWVSGVYSQISFTKQWSGGLNPPLFADDQSVTFPEYPFDRDRDDVAMAGLWPSHDFLWNFVAELPVGHGRRFASQTNKFLNAIIGDWSVTGAFSWRSGIPFTPTWSGVDFSNTGRFGGRADVVPGCDPYGGARDVHGTWFNPGCFAQPAEGTNGNAQINSLVGPGAWILNLNPWKTIPLDALREGSRLQIGANIVNFLNHPVYGNPVSAVNATNAGRILGTGNARGLNHDSLGQRKVILDMRIIF